MHPLDQLQDAIARAIDHGPAHLPDGLFAAAPERVLLGMKVHANTISHARLVALEDTFPRTREQLGADRFNQRSRAFVEAPGTVARPLALIGAGFPSFLAQVGEDAAIAGLAGFEWAWLETYHAADAPALTLAEVAAIDEAALPDMVVTRHGAARAAAFGPLVSQLIGQEVPGLDTAEAVLLARPDADVLVSPASSAMVRVLAAIAGPASICNLFESLAESGGMDGLPSEQIMPALIALIAAGAVQQAG